MNGTSKVTPLLTMHKLLLATLLTAAALSAVAAPIDPNAPAVTWNKATQAEKRTYALKAASACRSSNCGNVEIKACLDEALRPPAPPMKMTVSEAAATCIAILKSQE